MIFGVFGRTSFFSLEPNSWCATAGGKDRDFQPPVSSEQKLASHPYRRKKLARYKRNMDYSLTARGEQRPKIECQRVDKRLDVSSYQETE